MISVWYSADVAVPSCPPIMTIWRHGYPTVQRAELFTL
jgi:hypothetical protein